MQLAQHSLDLRKVIKSLKSLNSEEFKMSFQSERYLSNALLSSQEKHAVKSVFSVNSFGRNPEDKVKLGIWG